MKKFFPVTLFLLALVVVAGLTAQFAEPTLQTSSAVQIPEALKAIISTLLLAVVTLGLQGLFNTFGLDLRGLSSAIAVAVSGFVILQVQGYIDVIPAQYDNLIMIILNVLTVILGGIGTIRALVFRQHINNLFQQ